MTTRERRTCLTLSLLLCALVGLSGCGYTKNVADDFKDCLILGYGVTPPVFSTEENSLAAGFIPPSIGAYVEATNFLSLGAIYKVSGDIELDRRAAGITIDRRTKWGFGPWHHAYLWQQPVEDYSNNYKTEGNELDAWREYMRDLKDPLFRAPAKEFVYRGQELNYLYRGWQGWEVVTAEVAIPEPCILHSGFNLRAGFDLSEVADLAFGILLIDLYGDSAYDTWSGEPRPVPAVLDYNLEAQEEAKREVFVVP